MNKIKKILSILQFLLPCLLLLILACNKLHDPISNDNTQKNDPLENFYICPSYPFDDEAISKISVLIPFIADGLIENIYCDTCHFAHHNPWDSLSVTDHGDYYSSDPEACEECHGQDLATGAPEADWISCNICHHGTGGMAEMHAGLACETCHDFSGGGGGGSGDCASCHGTTGSHAIHVGANSKGPATPLNCPVCHDENSYPLFGDAGAMETLSETSVCDSCHSPGGVYDGVNDLIVGAKNNWSSGIYDGDLLQAGKENWCVTCHDNDPANSESDGSGIFASNIAGDGVSYGYYINGHLSELCTNCHDLSYTHIDGIERTYIAPLDVYTPGDYYQVGYRLKSISGEPPVVIPFRSDETMVHVESFRLCFSCHDNTKFIEETNLTSNFREDSTSANYHYYHLTSQHNPSVPVSCGEFCHSAHGSILALPWDSDWDGIGDSDMSCTACHNVHGSNGIAMTRTGELIGYTPGLNLRYLDNDPVDPWNFKDPQTLDGSTGAAQDLVDVNPIGTIDDNGICVMCHVQRASYYRSPVLP